ncbi:MAG: hypothetical protein AAGA96_16835 [Verrucomicrobiota bacterium]
MKKDLFRPFPRVFLLGFVSSLLGAASGPEVKAQSPGDKTAGEGGSRPSEYLPSGLTPENFGALQENSPFLRTINLSGSMILTGLARIENRAVASLVDVETNTSYMVTEGEISSDGWQLMEVTGDSTDVESLTARVRVSGGEVISIRYQESPPPGQGTRHVVVSNRVGNGTPGGGTGPHGGPDPAVLTPDQLADAKEGARNIHRGFQADGYADGERIPREVISKLSRLSITQRESVNVKMFEHRNRGLGMRERQQIYNRLLDRELGN